MEDERIENRLAGLFAAEYAVRRAHDDVVARLSGAAEEGVAQLRQAIEAAKDLEESAAVPQLVCMARLLGDLGGDRAIDGLIDILDSAWPEARSEAGEQLEGIWQEAPDTAIRGTKAALRRLSAHSPALLELPYVLAECPPPAVSALREFLHHATPDVVVCALDALAHCGESFSLTELDALLQDTRTARLLTDEIGSSISVTVGEFAAEVRQWLAKCESGGSESR